MWPLRFSGVSLPLPKGSVGLFSSADDDTGRGAHIIFYYDKTSYFLILGFIIDGRLAGEFTQRPPSAPSLRLAQQRWEPLSAFGAGAQRSSQAFRDIHGVLRSLGLTDQQPRYLCALEWLLIVSASGKERMVLSDRNKTLSLLMVRPDARC